MAVFALDERQEPQMPGAQKHAGRVAAHASGLLRAGNTAGLNAKSCKFLDRADGYGWAWRPALPPPADAGDFSA